jgi:DNA-binding HxlR family transcriptional regulator
MPKSRWTGYGRFCPLARALDIIGDRWTLVIVQELMKRTSRYGELVRRLPGISTTVLADRLRKLESAGLVERQVGAVGSGVAYAVTEKGRGLADSLEALRRWGVNYLADPSADGAACHTYDVHYVEGIDALDDREFGLVVDGRSSTLRFAGGHLDHLPGQPADPVLVVSTSSAFMERWAAGRSSWDDGLESGEVALAGHRERWSDWLAATGYLLAYSAEAGRSR